MKKLIAYTLIILFFSQCSKMNENYTKINRLEYLNKLEGFWLGQCIANWTGLITEMDKIGIPIDGKGGGFYTREDWGKPDQPNLWGSNELSNTINYIYAEKDSIWGADDDTDIEYIYQELLLNSPSLDLTGEQIRNAWINHIHLDEENFLWVSNQKAFDLMNNGVIPPETSNPDLNPHYEMIDAQLTTEIFGFFAPTKPEIAMALGYLPVRTTARDNAAWISEFNIIMYSLASMKTEHKTRKEKVIWMAKQARLHLPNDSYSAKMFDFVLEQYNQNILWEDARNALHEKYQIRQEDGYHWATTDKSCNGCFAAGINFGASIISLLYGEGDIKETIKIGALAGWDSDNPTATWGGLLGFMLGKNEVEKIFDKELSSSFNIHRTRKGFPNQGIDNFENMALKGQLIVDRVVQEKMGGKIDHQNDIWLIPNTENE
ncbi:MAG: ADP-ribosylglycohydrolase family protein [Flavobacteriaceae bacterium]|nr:ADP-ribosylglycohydrolase family protein [Flavobacteriaceae bacterium]